MEDLSPGCKRHPDYEIAVSFNILIPNISPADKVSLYSITPIKVAATGSTDAKIEAFPLSKFLRPAVYRQNASTVLKKPNNNDHPIIFMLAQLTLITFSKLHKGITPIAATKKSIERNCKTIISFF